MDTMTQAELRAFVQEMRQLANSPQSLGRKLREESEEKVTKAAKAAKPTKKQVSFDDFMKDLEG